MTQGGRPQWLLRLPEGGGNTDYVIDPTQAYIIQSDGQRSLEKSPLFHQSKIWIVSFARVHSTGLTTSPIS